MNTATVLGIGNFLLSDDGIGNYIVAELKKHNTSAQINFVVGETDFDFCISQIRNSDSATIIIIDAAIFGKKPGTITTFHIHSDMVKRNCGLSMHGLHLIDAISYLNPELEIFIIGIEPYDIRLNYGLSPVLSGLFEHLVKEVQIVISKLLFRAIRDSSCCH